MSEPAPKTRAKTPPPVIQQAAKKTPAPASAGGEREGVLQKAGPALGLGVQRAVAIGEPGDRHELEADQAADRISSGQSVQAEAVSPVTAETLAKSPMQPEKMEAAAPKAKAPPEKKPDAMPVQKKASGPGAEERKQDPKPVQKAEAKPAEKQPEIRHTGADEKKPVQAEAASGGAPGASMGAVAGQAIASKGPGQPLSPDTRRKLEKGFGADLGHVRVHDDGAAQEAARAINARAFTHGSDIWLGPGASQSDTRLMAHEATHVVQQGGGAQRMVQRAPAPAPAASQAAAAGAGGGKQKTPFPPADIDGNVIKIPQLRIPSYDRKANAIKSLNWPLKLPADTTRPPEQRQFWAMKISDGAYKANIPAKLKEMNFKPIYSQRTKTDIYYLKPKGDKSKNIIGDSDAVTKQVTTPTWDSSGAYHEFDVDHRKEVQLVGKDAAQDIDNMELLDSSANRSSGASIAADIDQKTRAAAVQLSEGEKPVLAKTMTDLKSLRAGKYEIEFEQADASYGVAGDPTKFWSVAQVRAGEHLLPLRQMTLKEVEDIRGDPTRLTLMTSSGLRLNDIDGWDKGKAAYPRQNFFPAFDLETVNFDPAAGGKMTGSLFPRHPPLAVQNVTWDINLVPGVDYGGALQVGLKTLYLGHLSPIQIGDFDLGPKGVVARGVVQPTIPLLQNASLDISINGPDVEISKTVSGSELSLPSPIKVTGSSLTITLSRSQLSVTGDVDFAIDRLGKGQISGMGAFGGSTGAGFGAKGYFELDKKVFDGEARIDAGYEKDDFWAKGHLAIGDGKIRGIKSAALDASFAQGAFSAAGKVEPAIPAVEQAGLSIDYSPEAGLKFSGDLAIKADTPGIAGGSLHVEAMQPPGGDAFKVKGTGTAKPKIPGIDSTLQVSYDDGAFDASVEAAYNKGRLKGSVTVGATNRPVSDGKPAGAAPAKGDAITVYGGGSVTLVIAPWLQGTVAIKLLPNGEIELAGEVALPSSLDVFPAKQLERNIFRIGIDIPIVGLAVAGQRVGIFANISGGLDVSAGIGPGQLQQLKLAVSYNPSHEESAHVTGDASLHVPAHAGLRLAVRGAIGAGLAIVSAQGGLEVGAELGLEGALDTGVHVDWSPAKGLTLDAQGEISVEPKLKVDLSGFVTVDADLLVTTANLYEKKWQLAAFEYGSGLRFGVSFPVHYQEGEPFNLSLDQVKFQVPDIDPKSMLTDLIQRLA